jgi:uncharacterized membrane protein HdeD (DUF308 family)
MQCPNCGLINPNTAQTCDCGYNFQEGGIEKLYVGPQKLPIWVKTLVIITVTLYTLSIISYFSGPFKQKLIINIIFLGLVIFGYHQLLQRKNWARYLLGILTLPFGVLLLTSPEVRLYCFQKKIS